MRELLDQVLVSIPRPAIAVSGGVDSVTLAAVASEISHDVLIVHATSPAVPPEATERLKRTAASRGWRMLIVTAGEFDDPRYQANPINRCFYCKTNLYSTIRSNTDRSILSGANLDDLSEYRPGLDAAKSYGVRHPYIEAQITKRALRAISRDLGLTEFAELPSSPCLSSRVETGIRIEASMLNFINEVETRIRQLTKVTTVRCRVRAESIAIELDSDSFEALDPARTRSLIQVVENSRDRPAGLPIHVEAYRNGSAFLKENLAHAV